ncbi:MAG: IS1 family transposase [Candidatus Margulisbacteria bacterium]|nr:IS1 family transposase [Candidatus Margulisiibacteriota bacterium]
MNCPKCQETSYYKNGKAMGRQRYKCKQCGCNFTQSKKQGYSLEKRLMALKLYLVNMINNNKSLGEVILSFRKKNEVSARQFIKMLEELGSKVSPSFMTKLEVYGEIPGPDLICKIAEVPGHNPEVF